VDENRVLVSALVAVRDAARAAVVNVPEQHQQSASSRAIKRNGNDAGRFAQHPSLQRVSRDRPTARAIKRTRSGKKARTYHAAIQVLDRVANPLSREDVRHWCDQRTLAQIRVLMGVVERLERGGDQLPPFRSEPGMLVAGRVEYHHARLLGDTRSLSGIVVGDLLIDVPDQLSDPSHSRSLAALRSRSESRRCTVVRTESDLDVAVALIQSTTPSGR
jgi:hypothetical protein